MFRARIGLNTEQFLAAETLEKLHEIEQRVSSCGIHAQLLDTAIYRAALKTGANRVGTIETSRKMVLSGETSALSGDCAVSKLLLASITTEER